MVWTKKQIKEHEEVSKILNNLKDEAFEYIKENRNCTELEVQKFILGKYKKQNLKSALGRPIVAFGPSSASPHYDPSKQKSSRKIKKGNVVKIDVWARFSGSRKPYGDITWMGYVGKKPSREILRAFNTVLKARDASISYIQKELKKKRLPTGRSVDGIAMKVLLNAGYKYRKEILHTTGHSIGTTSPHGRHGAVSSRNKNSIKKNLGYTIEPGLYFNKKFGIRSEIDFYIDSNYKFHITTLVQSKLTVL